MKRAMWADAHDPLALVPANRQDGRMNDSAQEPAVDLADRARRAAEQAERHSSVRDRSRDLPRHGGVEHRGLGDPASPRHARRDLLRRPVRPVAAASLEPDSLLWRDRVRRVGAVAARRPAAGRRRGADRPVLGGPGRELPRGRARRRHGRAGSDHGGGALVAVRAAEGLGRPHGAGDRGGRARCLDPPAQSAACLPAREGRAAGIRARPAGSACRRRRASAHRTRDARHRGPQPERDDRPRRWRHLRDGHLAGARCARRPSASRRPAARRWWRCAGCSACCARSPRRSRSSRSRASAGSTSCWHESMPPGSR